MKEFIEALRKSTAQAYNWLCEHAHELSNAELADIAREFIFAAGDKPNVRADVADCLCDLYEE